MNDWVGPDERGCKASDEDETIIASRYFERTKIRRRVGKAKPTNLRRSSSSHYFCRAPTSAFGMAQPLTVDSLLLPGNSVDDCESTLVILRHFGSCTVFRERWDNYSKDSIIFPKHTTRDYETEKLEYAVRHLCGCNCFMRAYAPCRDLWSLRQAILTSSLLMYYAGYLLHRWKCRLLPPQETESIFGLPQKRRAPLPRTVFVDPHGNFFPSISKVLQHLSSSLTQNNHQRLSSLTNVRLKRDASAIVTPTKRRLKQGRVASPLTTTTITTTTNHSNSDTPFGLLEELFVDDPWRLLLSTIFLNRTSRAQVDAVLHAFLQEWPTAQAVVAYGDNHGHNCDNGYHPMSQLLQPMGMRHRRAQGIVRFSRDYLNRVSSSESSLAPLLLTRSDVMKLYYCGEYAAAAYEIFIQRQYLHSPDPPDHALHMYLEYQRGRYCCN